MSSCQGYFDGSTTAQLLFLSRFRREFFFSYYSKFWLDTCLILLNLQSPRNQRVYNDFFFEIKSKIVQYAQVLYFFDFSIRKKGFSSVYMYNKQLIPTICVIFHPYSHPLRFYGSSLVVKPVLRHC